MKLGIILSTKEPEKAWNSFRFANASLKKGHQVQLFLMGEAVECEMIIHEKYNVQTEIEKYIELKGVLLACGTCLKSRSLDEKTSCPISTLNDCVELVEWADKMVNF